MLSEDPPPLSDHETHPGGVSIHGSDVKIGGDVVERDKIVHNIEQHIHQQAQSAAEEARKRQEWELHNLASGVSAFAERLLRTTTRSTASASPYRGLLAFRFSDADLWVNRRPLWYFPLLLLSLLFAAACTPRLKPTSLAQSNTPLPTSSKPPTGTTTKETLSVTDTETPASTRTGTASPTAIATISSTPILHDVPTLDAAGAVGTPSTAIPVAAALVDFSADVTNILLLGRDTSRGADTYRTDVIIVASVDATTNTVTLVSIPRDLFVWIPGWTMNRINTAAARGDAIGYGESGVDLLKQTIQYNLGIPIHNWIRIDFEGFRSAVDALAAVDVPVSCALQDWRLISPELDVQDPDNWEQFLLEPGLHSMDGDLALWYARTRRSTNDFDRSRRQQQVLRAIFDKALSVDVLANALELYGVFQDFVDTDIGSGQALSFVPLAASLDGSHIRSRFITAEYVRAWRTPAGAAVLLPDPELIQTLLAEAFAPARTNRLYAEPAQVLVRNGSADPDLLALALDNLAWAGFAPIAGDDIDEVRTITTLIDRTTSPKGSLISELQRVLSVDQDNIVTEPDAQAEIRYAVELGTDYEACLHQVRFAAPASTESAPPITGPQPAQVIVHAPMLKGDLQIDALFDEWEPFEYISDLPVFGPENWFGPEDAAAEWSLFWNAEYLFIGVRVAEDVFAQRATGTDISRGDGLEILLDADLASDLTIDERNDDDYQLGISPSDLFDPNGRPEAYLWWPEEREGPVQLPMAYRRVENESDWDGEIAIPWSLFGITPQIGNEFGFILSLTDNDRPGEIDLQSILTHVEARVVEDPTTWGRLVLDPPKPEE